MHMHQRSRGFHRSTEMLKKMLMVLTIGCFVTSVADRDGKDKVPRDKHSGPFIATTNLGKLAQRERLRADPDVVFQTARQAAAKNNPVAARSIAKRKARTASDNEARKLGK